MNLPNLLTILRIFFVPLLVAALVQEDLRLSVAGFEIPGYLLALATFLAAGLTDLLDGYLARRWKQVTTVGTLLDPIADKLLISAALISLVQIRQLPGWLAILIIAREFAVSGLRSIAAAEGYTIQASDLGKTKMAVQVVAISMLLLAIRYPELHPYAMWWVYAVVAFAMLSAVQYFRKFWNHIDTQTKLRRRKDLLHLDRQDKRERRRARRRRRFASLPGKAAAAAGDHAGATAPNSPSAPRQPLTPAP